MDFQRLLLVVALSLVLLLIWQAWEKEYGHPPVVATVPSQSVSPRQGVPVTPGAQANDVPAVAVTTSPGATSKTAPSAVPAIQDVFKTGQRIRIRTDVLNVTLNTIGGDIRQVLLPTYSVSIKEPNVPYALMDNTRNHLFVAQSGFTHHSGKNTEVVPNHYSRYQTEQSSYTLAPGKKHLVVDLHWQGPNGVKITKRYTFTRGSFLIKMAYIIDNGSAKPWQAVAYEQFQRTEPTSKSRFEHAYTGGAIWDKKDKYQKVSFSDMKKHALSKEITGGWAAMIQHYFLGAWVPNPKVAFHYYSQHLGPKSGAASRYVLGMYSAPISVAPGETKTVDQTGIFVGPKLQNTLATIAPGLDLTVDYGYLTFISKPLYWLLKQLDRLLGNWGWSIIILTILIKLAFYKLSETSYKSMANMRRMQPRMKSIKERYGDDRQRQNQALMELYKKEKINPLGGCLPIAIQIPVFIALYWVLLESVALRQAPWILWIQDLSTRDPYFILPVIMGVTMVIQQKLNPAPLDPIQAKVMMVLPVAFSVFFAFFPAGLVLYWVVNNSLSILQQWYITRIILKT